MESSIKASILEALEGNDEDSIGKPARPVLPLVGSMNVPISREEEETVEQ